MNLQIIMALRTKARNLIRNHWATGVWVADRKTGESWESYGGPDDIARLRDWLRDHNLWDGKKYTGQCNVCAEGSVFLASAIDPTKTDLEAQNDATRLLEHMTSKLPDRHFEWYDDRAPWGSIAEYNDEGAADEAEIIKTLFKD